MTDFPATESRVTDAATAASSISDSSITDRSLSEPSITDRSLSEPTITDPSISDPLLSDSTISDPSTIDASGVAARLDSLQPAAKLADLLSAINLDDVLPEGESTIRCDDLAIDRIELRQVAGISAGGRLELSAGSEYDFGPVRSGHGKLDDGQPDIIGFTLNLDADLVATVGPGNTPLTIDSVPVVAPMDVGNRVINAGSARFVVARPRPPHRRDGGKQDQQAAAHPWVSSLLPGPLDDDADPHLLFDRRRRLHAGPDDISYRIDGGGPLLWDRDPEHPLFGTAVVAVTDVPALVDDVGIDLAAPVSVDLLGSPTMLAGTRSLQLAVARHIVMSLAATVHPDDLTIELRSGCTDLQFIGRLPHGRKRSAEPAETGWVIDGDSGTIGEYQGPRRLVVVDRPQGHNRRLPPGFHGGRTSFLVLTGETDVLTADADVLSLADEETMHILAGEATRLAGDQRNNAIEIRGATPVGYAESMTTELVGMLAGRA